MARKRTRRQPKPATAPAVTRIGPDAGPPERARHGDTEVREVYDEHGRRIGVGRRTVAPIDRLRGSLDAPMLNAAVRYRDDFLAAMEGVRDTENGIQNDRVDRSRGNGACGPADWQIDASRRLAAATAYMTTFERPVVEAIIGREMPVKAYAAYHQVNEQQVTGMLKAALARLAEHYSERRRAA